MGVWGGVPPSGGERFAPRRDLLLPPVLAVEEGAHPPGAYFSHAGKVGKRALRGSTPKNPGIGRSGRGGSCFTCRIGSRQELPTMVLTIVRLPACENWEAKTRKKLLLGISCSLWCGANLNCNHRTRRGIGEKRLNCLPRQGLRPGRGRRGKTVPTRR